MSGITKRDLKPWRIITDGYEGPGRWQSADDIPTGLSFTWDPRPKYEQDFRKYPEQRYGTRQWLRQQDTATVTQAEVDAFTQAWEQALHQYGRGTPPRGTKTRAGLAAAFAMHDANKPTSMPTHPEQPSTIRDAANAAHAAVGDLTAGLTSSRLTAVHYAIGALEAAALQQRRTPFVEPRWEDQPRTDDLTYDQRLYHLARIDRVIEWLRTNLRTEHEQKHQAACTTAEEAKREERVTYQGTANPQQLAKSLAAVQKARDTMASKRSADSTVDGLRTNILSLLAIQDRTPENETLLRETVNALAAKAQPSQDITDDEIYAERQNQISKGYSARHDDEHGIRHLLLWAIQYGKRRKTVEALALIRAALESMARKGQDL